MVLILWGEHQVLEKKYWDERKKTMGVCNDGIVSANNATWHFWGLKKIHRKERI